MKKEKFSTRAYVTNKGQVMLRVRWEGKKNEVGFSVGYTIDPVKWDSTKQLVKSNTTHKINGKVIYAREINNMIRNFLSCIDEVFAEFSLRNSYPTGAELKESVNEKLGRKKKVDINNECEKTLKDILNDFLMARSIEGNWSKEAEYKYGQVWQQLTGCDPNISLETLDKNKMIQLTNWYITNNYKNRTITKQLSKLKTFLKWVSKQGYNLQPGILEYKPKLKVIPKVVTFLKYKELMHFMNYEFPQGKEYLSKARDMFCFMAFTSIRYSDLAALKPSNLIDGCLDFCTKKTDDRLHIALNEHAQRILDKYAWYKGETLLPVPSNQKLNEYLKEAAKMAGLNRRISQVYFMGNKRYEDSCEFWEQISCHDARRTFVCCSLALGIPPSVVMSCTGHSDYESMKPYIEVADETQKVEMEKWNKHSSKSEVISMIDKLNTEKLEQLSEYIRRIL